MNTPKALGCVLGLLLASSLQAGPSSDQYSYETSTFETSVPNELHGSLTVRRCATCPPTLVRLKNDSVFRVGRREVTFQAFRDHVRAGDNLMMTVHYNMREGTVKRIVVEDDARPARR